MRTRTTLAALSIATLAACSSPTNNTEAPSPTSDPIDPYQIAVQNICTKTNELAAEFYAIRGGTSDTFENVDPIYTDWVKGPWKNYVAFVSGMYGDNEDARSSDELYVKIDSFAEAYDINRDGRDLAPTDPNFLASPFAPGASLGEVGEECAARGVATYFSISGVATQPS